MGSLEFSKVYSRLAILAKKSYLRLSQMFCLSRN